MEPTIRLDRVGVLWRNAWQLYAERFQALTEIFLLPVLLMGLGNILRLAGGPVVGAFGGLISFAGALLSIVASAAAIYAYHHKAGFDESYRAGGRLFWSLLWGAILVALAVIGGFVMLVIPGMWLAIGITLWSYIVVLEDKRGTAAITRSREYVRGYWWAVFGRVLLLGLLTIGCYVVVGIPFVLVGGQMGQALASILVVLFLGPFSVAYHYTLYRNLVTVKPDLVATPVGPRSAFIVVAQVVGLVLGIGIFIGAILFGLSHSASGSYQVNYGWPASPASSTQN